MDEDISAVLSKYGIDDVMPTISGTTTAAAIRTPSTIIQPIPTVDESKVVEKENDKTEDEKPIGNKPDVIATTPKKITATTTNNIPSIPSPSSDNKPSITTKPVSSAKKTAKKSTGGPVEKKKKNKK